MKKCISITLFLLMALNCVFSRQNADTASVERNSALNVFFDCGYCDMDFFRTNFTIVNYVNEYKDADVHVLVTSLSTGSGGSAYHIILQGYGKFMAMVDTLTLIVPEDATVEQERSALLDKIQLGLVPYILKTPYADKLFLVIDESPVITDNDDPWKSWVFEVSGSGAFSSQKTSQNLSVSGNLFLSKVTPDLKIESGNYFGHNESKLRLYDDDTLIYSLDIKQRDWSSTNLFVKSLGKHAGIGGFANFGKSDYSNLDFLMSVGPAVEFNVYSFDQATDRKFTFSYTILYEYADYKDMTVYNKMTDYLFRHELSINYNTYETWGTISAYAYATGYLNDLAQYSAGASAIASIRLSRFCKGLSFDMSGGFAYCQNQRSLSQEAVSTEELLTGQREMEKDFGYSFRIGISYRFGSRNNNAVNPRFEF